MSNIPKHKLPFSLGIEHPRLKSINNESLLIGIIFLGFTSCSPDRVGLYMNIVGLSNGVVKASITSITLLLSPEDSGKVFDSLGSDDFANVLQQCIITTTNISKVMSLVNKSLS